MRPDGSIGPPRHQKPALEVYEWLIARVGDMWRSRIDTREMARQLVVPEAAIAKALRVYRARQLETEVWEKFAESPVRPGASQKRGEEPQEENKMALYRRKPTANEPFEAVQWWNDSNPVKTPVHPGVFHDEEFGYHVVTIHGQRTRIKDGDWILPEPDGVHFYPCNPTVFAARYESVPAVAPYPGPMNGDRAQFELDHANTKPEDRPDWPLPSFDARDWAKAFCKVALAQGMRGPDRAPIDEGWMTTWFANALMRGYDEGVVSAHAAARLVTDRQISREQSADLTKRAT